MDGHKPPGLPVWKGPRAPTLGLFLYSGLTRVPRTHMPTNLPEWRDRAKKRRRDVWFRVILYVLRAALAFTCAMIIWSLWWYAWG
jgi:hypothetical protein